MAAEFWQSRGAWWICHRPRALLEAIEWIIGPLIEKDVAQAEDTLELISFLAPTFLAALILWIGFWLLKNAKK